MERATRTCCRQDGSGASPYVDVIPVILKERTRLKDLRYVRLRVNEKRSFADAQDDKWGEVMWGATRTCCRQAGSGASPYVVAILVILKERQRLKDLRYVRLRVNEKRSFADAQDDKWGAVMWRATRTC